ncbi:TIGR02270 family protein [Myxococcus sp. CA039A]|uniref:TIGR02270 family protein n=1 Tax=Myxococcus sp. CA039A TaxID=2741737 RepID=UPI00157B1549|nr:TIGR02270 family protein [Myxococcus sp. CA039A]NTX51025.1 TIGR02270 family protein [Myxococcus sp. CA039A]
MPVLLMDIQEEHLDEASFLWGQWNRTLVAPDRELRDAASLEERLLAHLDGLVVGGEPVARELLLPALDSEDPPRISAALWVLLAKSGRIELANVVERLQTAPEGTRAALQQALELCERPDVADTLLSLVKPQVASRHCWALEVLGARGQLPRDLVVELLGHPDGRVVVAALRTTPFLSRDVALRELPRLLADSRPGVKDAAVIAGMIAGVPAAWETVRKSVAARTKSDPTALVLLAFGGNGRDLTRLLECTDEESMREDALWALGFSGWAKAAETCLAFMESTALASLAGEAFSAITGLKLEGAYVKAPEEEDSLPPLEEDLSRDLELRPEHALPRPAGQAVSTWWKTARTGFAADTRYLRGREFSVDALLDELEWGPMRRRHMLALEFSVRSRGAWQFQTRAFTRRQHAGLAQARELKGRLPAIPFPRMLAW